MQSNVACTHCWTIQIMLCCHYSRHCAIDIHIRHHKKLRKAQSKRSTRQEQNIRGQTCTCLQSLQRTLELALCHQAWPVVRFVKQYAEACGTACRCHVRRGCPESDVIRAAACLLVWEGCEPSPAGCLAKHDEQQKQKGNCFGLEGCSERQEGALAAS